MYDKSIFRNHQKINSNFKHEVVHIPEEENTYFRTINKTVTAVCVFYCILRVSFFSLVFYVERTSSKLIWTLVFSSSKGSNNT